VAVDSYHFAVAGTLAAGSDCRVAVDAHHFVVAGAGCRACHAAIADTDCRACHATTAGADCHVAAGAYQHQRYHCSCIATDAMSAFTVTNNCGRIKHQMDDAWGLLHPHLIMSPKASFLIRGQLAVHANDTAGPSMTPQTDCAGNSQLRHMSARRGWTPGIMFTGLLSPFTLLTVREQLTRLYRFPTLAR
jgi:hypothetical protein